MTYSVWIAALLFCLQGCGTANDSESTAGSAGRSSRGGAPSLGSGGSRQTAGSNSQVGGDSHGGFAGETNQGGNGPEAPIGGGDNPTLGGTSGVGGQASGGAGGAQNGAVCTGGPTPPSTWKEHWFEHNQTLDLVYHDDCIAVYFDADVDREKAKWLFPFLNRVWQYALKTYGKMGEDRMFFIFHQGKYFGGHPSTWHAASHDFRNVSDVGGGDWSEKASPAVTTHEVAHIVEFTAFYPKKGAPGFKLWGDSKWAEFFQYDLYVGLGMTEQAEKAYRDYMAKTDALPPNGVKRVAWFKDWFYPLWRDHGHGKVMANFFHLLRDNIVGDRMPSLNMGQYVHFTSGAAGKDLRSLAENAFGWKPEWTAELEQAKKDYPRVKY